MFSVSLPCCASLFFTISSAIFRKPTFCTNHTSIICIPNNFLYYINRRIFMKATPIKRIVLVISMIIGICFLSTISIASPIAPGNAASSDTTKVKRTPKKKRVPKKKASTTKTESTSSVTSEEDESFWEACLGDCLGSLFASLLGGDDDGEAPTTDYYANEPEIQTQTSTKTTDRDIVLPPLPCSARVAPDGTSNMAGALWDKPGGASTGAVLQTKITAGTEITIVHQYKAMVSKSQEETWVKVEVKGGAAEGWMRISDVTLHGAGSGIKEETTAPKPVITQQQTPMTDSVKPKPTSTQRLQVPSVDSTITESTNTQEQESDAEEESLSELVDKSASVKEQTPPTSPQADVAVIDEMPSESTNEMESMQPEGYRDIGDSRWQLLADFSITQFGNGPLREEYHYEKGDSGGHNLGYSFGGAIKYLPTRILLIDASFGYTFIDGNPQYEYVIGNKTDSPQDSDLSIFNLSIGVGQLYSFAGGKGFFTWNIGPTLYKVNESAKIDMYIDDDLVGDRTEEISVWKLGADVKLEVGGAPIDRLLLAFYTRVSVVPWDSKEEKSLTLDYLGHSSFTYFRIGLSIGTAFY
jgi:hypothetical protein